MSVLIETGADLNEFNLKMSNRCFVCQNPTLITLKVYDALSFIYSLQGFMEPYDMFTMAFKLWQSRRPLRLKWNQRIYKRFGSSFRTVCLGCYSTDIKHDLRGRETGQCKFTYKSKSSSYEEIYNWFCRFNNFRNQKYIETILEDEYY